MTSLKCDKELKHIMVWTSKITDGILKLQPN